MQAPHAVLPSEAGSARKPVCFSFCALKGGPAEPSAWNNGRFGGVWRAKGARERGGTRGTVAFGRL